MPKKRMFLILDLDGVLITTPPWKTDEIDSDGYSTFNHTCIENLNNLLNNVDAEIWLSSTRRRTKTLNEFNAIFKHRKINTPIAGFLPKSNDLSTRKEEIESFLERKHPEYYLILDDDKSLNDLPLNIKTHWVQTELLKGFTQNERRKALKIIDSWE